MDVRARPVGLKSLGSSNWKDTRKSKLVCRAPFESDWIFLNFSFHFRPGLTSSGSSALSSALQFPQFEGSYH